MPQLSTNIAEAVRRSEAQNSKPKGDSGEAKVYEITTGAPRPQANEGETEANEGDIDEDGFWETRPELRKIRDFARARRVAPWSTFGYVLTMACSTIPPSVVLPPLRGGVASLNQFVGIVGESGAGKGSAAGAAKSLLRTKPAVFEAKLGSGEGIGKLYAEKKKATAEASAEGKAKPNRRAQWKQDPRRNSVLFDMPEVDVVRNLGVRSGATLTGEIRSAWSGERLGFTNSDQERTVQIEHHRYRLCLMVGVQPERADALLGESAGGTPQRFLWLPITDPNRPKTRPAEPGPLCLREWRGAGPLVSDAKNDLSHDLDQLRLDEPMAEKDFHVLDVPQVVEDAVEREANRILDGDKNSDDDALRGHAILVRLKVAATLMWLNGRQDGVTEEDWELAGVVQQVSDRTLASIQAKLAKARAEQNQMHGRAQGQREVAARDVREKDDLRRATGGVTRYLKRRGGTATRKDLRDNAVRRDIKPLVDDAIDTLVDAGLVTVENKANGSTVVTLAE